jgi:two-component system chemotaxis response regulator CheY
MKTVLVVDDSRIMRNIVKNTFSNLGIPCEYLEAEDGQAALQQLITQKVDIVFCDWNMPKMSGIELLTKIRTMDTLKTVPFIMVTSESAKYSVIEALKAGATDYIVKPVNEKILMEKLKKINMAE